MFRWKNVFALLISALSVGVITVLSEYTTRAVPESQAVEVQSLKELHEVITGESFIIVSFYSYEDPFCRALIPEFIKASIRIHNDSNYQTLFAQVDVDRVFKSDSDKQEAERLFQIDINHSNNGHWCPKIRYWTTVHSDGIKRMLHYDDTQNKRQQYWLMEYVRMQETPCFEWYQSLVSSSSLSSNQSNKQKNQTDSKSNHTESNLNFFADILTKPDPSVWPPESVDKFADHYLLNHVPERTPPIAYGQLCNPMLQRDFEEICIYTREFYDWSNAIAFTLLTPKEFSRSNDNDESDDYRTCEVDMDDDQVWIQYHSPTGLIHSVTIYDDETNNDHSLKRKLSDVFHSTISTSFEIWRHSPVYICDPSTFEHIIRICQLSKRKIVWIAVEEEIDNRRDYLTEYASPFLNAVIDSSFDLSVSESYQFGQHFLFSIISFILYPDFVRDSLGCPYLPCVVVTDPTGYASQFNSYLRGDSRNNKNNKNNRKGKSQSKKKQSISSEKFLFDPRIPIVDEQWKVYPNQDLISFLNMIILRPQYSSSSMKRKDKNINIHIDPNDDGLDVNVYRKCEDYENKPDNCYLTSSLVRSFNLTQLNSLYNGTVYHDCTGACLDALLCSQRRLKNSNIIVLYYASKDRTSMKSVPKFIDIARYFTDTHTSKYARGTRYMNRSDKDGLLFVMVDVTVTDTAQYLDSVPVLYFYPKFDIDQGKSDSDLIDPLPTDYCITDSIQVESEIEFKPLNTWIRRRLLMSQNHLDLPFCKDPSQVVVTECPIKPITSLLPG